MYSAGREGRTAELDLDNAGVSTDDRGRIQVDRQFRTGVDHICVVNEPVSTTYHFKSSVGS